ncbi:hypothetical protein, partial [Pseudomonas entomophila]|uniref:hypothetical protein n=1 Tax=Pseudomonas entomophila TaxID=312306 RepID=UPI003D6637DC
VLAIESEKGRLVEHPLERQAGIFADQFELEAEEPADVFVAVEFQDLKLRLDCRYMKTQAVGG